MAGTRGCALLLALLLALLQAQRARAPDVEALRARSRDAELRGPADQGWIRDRATVVSRLTHI